MTDNANYVELVKKAQSGCKQSMDDLVQLAEKNVSAYIYRLTLDYHAAQDILQDTLLEIVRSLKNIRCPEAFWAWTYRTALGKVQHYFRVQKRHRKLQEMATSDKERLLQRLSDLHADSLNNLINKELSQAVIDAMAKLRIRYRNILVLRLCEQLSYPEIAEVMDCSEMAARVLFFRAKRILKQKISRHSFGAGSMLLAMGLFGQMTAPADAGAAFTIPAASAKVGTVAALIGAATTKLGVTIAVMATTAIFVTSAIHLNDPDTIAGFDYPPKRTEIKSFHYIEQAWEKTSSPNKNLLRGRSLSKGAYEQWYYFPDGIDGPLFMIMQRWDPRQKNKQCGWMQNATGNYYYNSGSKTLHMYDYHLPMRKLSTRRLPSDTTEFTEFLNQVEGEGERTGLEYERDDETGLLVGVLDNRFYNAQHFKSRIAYNKVNEKSFGSFRHKWPADTPIVDERDQMHQRGWTYFRVDGQINGQWVGGSGRIPFVFDEIAAHPPWLKLNVGNNLQIVDGSQQAYLADGDGKIIASYPPGTFIKELSRPWMGMHVMDLIRRDAVQKRIEFAIEPFGGDKNHYGKVKVMLFTEPTQLDFIVDIDKDVIEKIQFPDNTSASADEQNVINFRHLQDIDQLADEFTEPEQIKIPKKTRRPSISGSWLAELAQGTLGK